MISISKISPEILEMQYGFVVDKCTGTNKHAPRKITRSTEGHIPLFYQLLKGLRKSDT